MNDKVLASKDLLVVTLFAARALLPRIRMEDSQSLPGVIV